MLEKVGPIIQALVTLAVLTAFFWAVAFLLQSQADIPSSVRDVLLVLVGVLAGAFKDTVGFWLGSSYGSARKTEATINGKQ